MRVRKLIYERFDMSLGTGLGKVKGRMFRIGHLGDCNDLTLMAALAGCEMGLKLAGVKLAGLGRAGRHGLSSPRHPRHAHAEGGLRAAGPRTSGEADMQRRTFITGVAGTAASIAPADGARPEPAHAGRSASSSGFAPGGGTDVLARVIGQKLSDDVEHAGHRGEQGRRFRRASPPTTWPSSRVTAARC